MNGDRMTDTRAPEPILARTAAPGSNGRPVRKDEIELVDRGLYIESWLPERRSRRKPLLLIHGELAGSWVWERYLGYFAGRGWEGHALNLRNHHWSSTADPAELSFESYTEDVVAAMERLPDEQRLVVALVLVEGLAYKEAAEVLEVPIGTVTSRLARGREALEALLGGRGGGTS